MLWVGKGGYPKVKNSRGRGQQTRQGRGGELKRGGTPSVSRKEIRGRKVGSSPAEKVIATVDFRTKGRESEEGDKRTSLFTPPKEAGGCQGGRERRNRALD